MAIELVTGYQGKDHVTAEQWADFNRGIFGEAAILPVGNRMETAIQTANQITVKDGVAVLDGRQVYIAYGESENIAIQSGTQGMQRRDIVVLEYKRKEESGVESVQFKVISGTPAASGAKDPSVQDMDIRTGVTVSQKPFCRVRLNGTAIEGVDALVQVKEFKPHAFAAPVNNLAGTNPELALAATQGRELKKQVDVLNSALVNETYQPIYVDDKTQVGFCYAKLKNGYVNLQGQSDSELKIPAHTYFDFTTLPKKYRPTINIFFPMISANNEISMFGVIYADTGIFKIYSTKETAWWRYSVTYPN